MEIGSKVSLVDDNCQAYILEMLDGGLLRVELDDDFTTQMTIHKSKVVVCNSLSDYRPNKIKQKDSKATKSAPIKASQQTISKSVLEVDLHAEKLITNLSGVENILEIQLRKVSQVLSENKTKRGLKIVLIHGNGKGILKKEILKVLKRHYPTFKISDASMSKYGTGAINIVVN